MSTYIRYLIGIIIVFLILWLSSCSPAKRIQRICDRHPEVCKRDTIIKTFEAEVFNDTIYQDSIITLVLNECDSILKARKGEFGDSVPPKIDRIRIKKLIKPQLPIYRCLTDTLTQEFENGIVKIWQDNDKIKCSLLNIQPAVVIVEEKKKWYDFDLGFSGLLILAFSFLVIGFILGKR